MTPEFSPRNESIAAPTSVSKAIPTIDLKLNVTSLDHDVFLLRRRIGRARHRVAGPSSH
jgi:hypothetical protein